LAVVAFYLLEPESDDGLVTWNVIDPGRRGSIHPVWRLAEVAPRVGAAAP
jgi:hypothetical protein